jgi:hypothetical protein
MSYPVVINGAHLPKLSALDQQALSLLMLLKDNPEVQQDAEVFELYKSAISFMTNYPFDSLDLPTFSSATSHVEGMPYLSTTPELTMVSEGPFCLIDASGKDGENGFPGTAAISPGGSGFKGTEGTHGKNADDIHLQLSLRDKSIIAQWDKGAATMRLGDPDNSIRLRAVGGKGGDGGFGGKGGPGTNGANGMGATRFSMGANGERGHPGGGGGNGGDGGNGGKGGTVRVYVNPRDSDLLMLLSHPQVSGGAKGKGGIQGKGGTGGRGGAGGLSCSWTEIVYETRQVYDSFSRRYRTEQSSRIVSHSNPSGSDGADGAHGTEGRTGAEGRTGMDGSFTMIVGGTSYQAIYDLVVKVSKIVDLSKGNPADIYEPGEEVNLKVSVMNTGGMPTPEQDIEISLRPAAWIKSKNAFDVLKTSVPIGGSYTFSTPFSFIVDDLDSLTEEPLNKREELTYQAFLPRVNKSFPHVSQQKDLCSVRYPVQISPLQGKSFLTSEEISTLSLLIQNISTVKMGKEGPQKRRVFVTFEIAECGDIRASDVSLLKTAEKDLQEPNKITVEVDDLPPKSEKKMAVSFRFINPQLPTQSKIGVVASLHLGYFNSGRSEELGRTRCIQKRSFQIQLC